MNGPFMNGLYNVIYECIFPMPRRFYTWRRQLSDKQFDVSIIKLLLSHVLAFENVSAGRSSLSLKEPIFIIVSWLLDALIPLLMNM